MGGFLRQSTASQARAIGPFVDDTDFKTAETGLTIANTDIKLVINGAASANKNSGGGTHRVNGVYGVTFDATDTATVGEIEVSVVVAGALPVFDKFYVVEEAVYDALFVASAPGYGTAQTGDSYAVVNSGTFGNSALKTLIDAIDDFVDTEVAAIKAKTDGLPSDPADASDIAALFATVNTKLDTIDDFIDTEVAAIKAKTDNLPSDPADASDIAALFVAINTKLDTIDDFIDTEVAAIKAKTDSLTFTAAGKVDANILAINGSTAADDNLARGVLGSVLGTVGSGSTTTSIVTSALDPAAAVTDQFKGRIVTFDRATTTANLRGQATDITGSTSGGVLTVTALTDAPVSTDTFVIT